MEGANASVWRFVAEVARVIGLWSLFSCGLLCPQPTGWFWESGSDNEPDKGTQSNGSIDLVILKDAEVVVSTGCVILMLGPMATECGLAGIGGGI